MRDHENPERLASFADVLAGELPGAWASVHHPPEDKEDLADLTDRIWDMDLVAESLAEHPFQRAAVLTRQDGAQLIVLNRSGGSGFLVAAVAPSGLPAEAFRGIREPDGIAVSDDPFQSAELVAGDLLARFDTALAHVRWNAAGVRPSQPDRVILTWQPDGSLAAASVSEEAAEILTANGFVRDQSGIYRLSSDDTTVQARAVRAIGPQLDAHGITTALQHPSGRTAPSVTPPTSMPTPAPAGASLARIR
ncbi:hypothetical protein ACFV1B_14850 [Streptomyces sp. NPDC059637]|uniref:hypothetical protein n=1 Tax=Streptomyces sp. NPDC059637 TaxID=3347752 RepID=UPI0036AE8F17